MDKKKSNLQVVLTLLFVVSLLISNIVGAKQMQIPGGIIITSAICVFPVTYILSDVFSEVYGYKWSRATCYMAFAFNIYMVLMFKISLIAPAPEYFQNQSAMEAVLGSTPRMLFASLAAYVIGDYANDVVFKKMKEKHEGNEGFKSRAIMSSLVGNFVDSFVFNPLAFYGIMPVKTMLITIVTYAIAKTVYESICVPLTDLVVRKVQKYELRCY